MSLLPQSVYLLRASSRRLPAVFAGRFSSSATRDTSSSAAAAPDAAPAADATTAADAPAADAAPDAPLFSMPNPYLPERRQCIACSQQIRFDYKNVRLLSQFVSPFTGRMYGRHVTGLCREQQKRLEEEYRRAVACGYMGVMMKAVEFVKDPKICDPTNPVRPHRF